MSILTRNSNALKRTAGEFSEETVHREAEAELQAPKWKIAHHDK